MIGKLISKLLGPRAEEDEVPPRELILIELDGVVIEVEGDGIGMKGVLPEPYNVPDNWIEKTSLSSRMRQYETRKKK